jgi:hypothetical protein
VGFWGLPPSCAEVMTISLPLDPGIHRPTL